MNGTDNVILEKLIVHKVGNPSRGEELELATNFLEIDDEITSRLLTKYFLHSINENELHRFTHISDLKLNEAYNYISTIFEDPESFLGQSQHLASFLYSKSTHVRVKEGELYIARFKDLPFEGDFVSGIGIFKTETKEQFLKLVGNKSSWELISDEGFGLSKPDKGCLVFHSEGAEGYKVSIIDHTNKQQDAQYWVNDFLQVQPWADSYHNTDKYLNLCRQFVTNEYADKFEVSKSDQADLLNRSMDYFKTHEQFDLKEFTTEVIHHPELVNTFMDYKKNFEEAKKFEIEDQFDINTVALKKQQKVFKTVLKLDRNFHIYIHGRRDLIERGVEEGTGRKYYKIYFEEEQ